MSTISNGAMAHTEPEEELAAHWPQFSGPELRRLRFLAYRRATRRLRPVGPLRATGGRVCEEIAAYLCTPAPPTLPLQDTAAPGVPPLWRAWMAGHGSAHHAHRLWEASA